MKPLIKTFSTFQNYSLITEARGSNPEKDARQQLKELLFEDQDKDDIESLFLNIKDYGFEVSIEKEEFDWESTAWTGFDFIRSVSRTLKKDGFALWTIKIHGDFDNPVDSLSFIFDEFKRIKKRCKVFIIDDLKTWKLDERNSYEQDLQAQILVTLESDANKEKIRKTIQDLRDAIVKDSYDEYLIAAAYTFVGKQDPKLEEILRSDIIRLSSSHLPPKITNNLKRRLFELDNNRMVFTYDLTTKDRYEANTLIRKKYKTTMDKKASRPQKSFGYISSRYDHFEVIIHLKEKNTYGFRFKDDETIAYEVRFDNQALKTGLNKEGKSIYGDYVQEIQKLIDYLK